MGYNVRFSTSRDICGKATYLTKQFKCTTPPYQFERPDGSVNQYFIFSDLDELGRYLCFINKELKDQFKLESIIRE